MQPTQEDTCSDAAHLHHERWLIRSMFCPSFDVVAVLYASKVQGGLAGNLILYLRKSSQRQHSAIPS